jgi:protein SCO1/2
MRTARFLFPMLLLVPLIAGCKQSATDQEGGKEYDIRGKVVAVEGAKPTVTLDHESIPGLMEGMTMEFKVEKPEVVAGLQAGDKVEGRIKKADSGLVITKLEKRSGP